MGDAMSGPRKFVFCEGKDDVAVIRSLAKELGLVVTIEDYGGKKQADKFLQGLSNVPNLPKSRLPPWRFFGMRTMMRWPPLPASATRCGKMVFEAPDANENFKESTPRVGVFIVGVNGKGMIEDLC